MPDLWPEDIGSEGVQPPMAILREQAEHLNRRTGGLITASVLTKKNPSVSGFWHRFILEVPSLDDYSFALFSIVQPIVLYPVDLLTDIPNVPVTRSIPDPASLEESLRSFFSHKEVRAIVAALKAQATAGLNTKP